MPIIDDPRMDILKNISTKTLNVNVASAPFIFLCGGLVDLEKHPAPSVRDDLMRYLADHDSDLLDAITVPESFKDWAEHSVFPDLHVFENQIGQISSLIVIVLESEGAIAELGLFTENKTLKKKLTVFVEDDHYTADSFIRLGPLNHLINIDNNSVYSYPWKDSRAPQLPAIAADIRMRIDMLQDITKFAPSNNGHIAFLIFELVKMFRALKISEIVAYLRELGVSKTAKAVKPLLFLLQKFGLLNIRRRGNTDFYYAVSSIEKIAFGGKINSVDTKIKVTEYYNNNPKESERKLLIKSIS